MRPVLRGRLHCGGISFFRFVHNGVQQFAGADAERIYVLMAIVSVFAVAPVLFGRPMRA